MHKRARAFAKRLLARQPASRVHRVDHAYRLAFARPPTPRERAAALAFLVRQSDLPGVAPDSVWTDLCRALLNTNEFLYVF